MARCIITLTDGLDGDVEITADFDPPLGPGRHDGVYALGRRVLSVLWAEDEIDVSVHPQTEPDA